MLGQRLENWGWNCQEGNQTEDRGLGWWTHHSHNIFCTIQAICEWSIPGNCVCWDAGFWHCQSVVWEIEMTLVNLVKLAWCMQPAWSSLGLEHPVGWMPMETLLQRRRRQRWNPLLRNVPQGFVWEMGILQHLLVSCCYDCGEISFCHCCCGPLDH